MLKGVDHRLNFFVTGYRTVDRDNGIFFQCHFAAVQGDVYNPCLFPVTPGLNDDRPIDVDGFGEGVCAVAVAIRDYAGKVVGALTMLIPTIKMVQDRLENEVIPSMLEGAEQLSMKFGYVKIPVC